MASPSGVGVRIDRQGRMVIPAALRDEITTTPGDVIRRDRSRALVAMMDTSVLVTSLVRGHEHHARARAELPAVVSLPVMATALARATELDLAGNIHDALIALACVEHDLPIVTLDARQHQVALALGARSTDLLA